MFFIYLSAAFFSFWLLNLSGYSKAKLRDIKIIRFTLPVGFLVLAVLDFI